MTLTTTTTILLVEDNPGDARLLREVLAEASSFPHAILHVDRLATALEMMTSIPVDVLLLDLTLPDATGLAALRTAHAAHPKLPIVVLTGLADEALAIEAMKSGAQDYLVKGEADARLIVRSIRYAVERSRADEAARRLDRAQTEHAIAQAERARLYSLFMQAPAGIAVILGPELRIDLANPQYLQLVGKPASVVGQSLLAAMPELVGQGFDEILLGVLTTGKPFFGKEVLCRLDLAGTGTLTDVIFDFVYEPVRDARGEVEGVMVICADVTDQVLARQRVEDARRAAALSEQRFQLLAEVIPQIVWSMAPDGSEAYLSPRWFEYTGQTHDEPLAERWRRALHPDDHDRVFALWAESIKGASLWQTEYRLRRHDGEYRWHLGRSVPHHQPDGDIIRWYGTATDIDEQRRAIRSRDDLLATVSHDLRSPLSAISMAVELLAESALGADAKYLGVIERSTKRMEQLIKDLLDMASIESGHLSVEPAPLGVRDVVEEAVDLIQPLAAAKTVQVETDVTLAKRPVHGDRSRVLQVLSNILGNAVKFTSAPGRISVKAGAADDRFVKFAISDTGPGIEPSQIPYVFDRFWQAKETARAGTGLGLAICKGIIQQHGGSIWVESQLGVGTTFYFTLPVAGSGPG